MAVKQEAEWRKKFPQFIEICKKNKIFKNFTKYNLSNDIYSEKYLTFGVQLRLRKNFQSW